MEFSGMTDMSDLLNRLPTQKQLDDYFCTADGDARMNMQPYIIARHVPADLFTDLLERITADDCLSSRFAYMELEKDGTLQVYEMRSTWHEIVVPSIHVQIARRLEAMGISSSQLYSTGSATDTARQRAPNGNWVPAWSADELQQIRAMFQGDNAILDPDIGTLVVEVAFSETLEHAQDKTKSSWLNPCFGGFPLMVLIVNFGDQQSDRVVNSQEQVQISAELYQRTTERDRVQPDLIQMIEFGDGHGCDQPGIEEFQIRLPMSLLMFGTRFATEHANVFVNIDLYEIKKSIDQHRLRRRKLAKW